MGTMPYAERMGQGIILILGRSKNVGKISVMLISHQPIRNGWVMAERQIQE